MEATQKTKDSGSTDRFGYEWNAYSAIIPEYEEQFLKWIEPLKPQDFNGKKVLDAGCGMGRNSYWPLKYGAKKVFAFDYNESSVNAAKKNLSAFNNCEVSFGSIYDIPFKNEFDISFSIGVIHHLESPREAIKNLVKATKKNGLVLIWVYGYEGNEWIPKYLNPIRKNITSKLPLSLVHLISYFLAIPLYSYIKLIPQKKPYYQLLSKFKFWHIRSVVFDQLIPRIANYWKKQEALALFENQGLKDIQIYHTNNYSWTLIGKKS